MYEHTTRVCLRVYTSEPTCKEICVHAGLPAENSRVPEPPVHISTFVLRAWELGLSSCTSWALVGGGGYGFGRLALNV